MNYLFKLIILYLGLISHISQFFFFYLDLVNYFPIVCGVLGVLQLICISFIKGKRIPNNIILVCVAIVPTIIAGILHILAMHYSLDILTSATLLLG